jgi:26S proteasome regulatory subunit N8
VPFEEDENDPSIWFLDHSYLEKMSGMFRRINGARTSPPALFPRSGRSFETRAGSDKATAALQKIRFGSVRFFLVAEPGGAAGEPSDLFSVVLYPRFASPRIAHPTAKEKIVGWYSTGPKIRAADLDIHALFAEYCATPAFCIIDTRPDRVGIPVSAYLCENEIRDDGTQKEEKTFVHVPSLIEAFEAEEIGVEHLLRDVKDNTVSTLATRVSEKMSSLDGLEKRLRETKRYMELVVDGSLPVNHEILGHLQDVFNLLPNLNLEAYVKAFAVKTNDAMLVMYLSSLIRAVIALHALIANKQASKEKEKAMDLKLLEAARPDKSGKEGPESAQEETEASAKK